MSKEKIKVYLYYGKLFGTNGLGQMENILIEQRLE